VFAILPADMNTASLFDQGTRIRKQHGKKGREMDRDTRDPRRSDWDWSERGEKPGKGPKTIRSGISQTDSKERTSGEEGGREVGTRHSVPERRPLYRRTGYERGKVREFPGEIRHRGGSVTSIFGDRVSREVPSKNREKNDQKQEGK